MQDIGHKELIHFAACVIIKEGLQKDILMYIETFFGLEDDNNDV